MPDYYKIFNKNKEIIILIVLITFSMVCLFFSSDGYSAKIKEAGFTVISFFPKSVHKVGSFFTGTVNSIQELRKLRVQYNELQDKISEYQEIERNLQELTTENNYLRDQLGFSSTLKYSNIPAEVVGKDPGNKFSSIIISKGKSAGIKKNMPVVALQDGYHGLVGKVIEVGDYSSIIVPIYNTSAYVSSRLQESRYEGLINGRGFSGNLLNMEYVKKTARSKIKYGDLVITSGMKSIFPKGIYIGRVVAIEAKEWDTSLNLTVEPIVDFTRLEYVFVLKREENEKR